MEEEKYMEIAFFNQIRKIMTTYLTSFGFVSEGEIASKFFHRLN